MTTFLENLGISLVITGSSPQTTKNPLNGSFFANWTKAFSKLDQIVHDIEDDSISLDEMITLFEQGMLLTKICNKKLKEAEKKIGKLLNQSDSLDKWYEYFLHRE